MPLSQQIACRNPESLTNGRVLVGEVRFTREDEQEIDYYLKEPVPVPDPDTIREPTCSELESLVADPEELNAVRLFRPPASLGREVLKIYEDGFEQTQELPTITLAEGLLARVAILHAAPNQLSTSISNRPSHHGRKPGLHQDMHATPTYGAGLCLKGSRYIAIADITIRDIDPELLKENTLEARDRRRAAFRNVVQASIERGDPRKCVLLRVDEGEMYSGVWVSGQAHDGSTLGQGESSLALMITAQPLPPDIYDQVL